MNLNNIKDLITTSIDRFAQKILPEAPASVTVKVVSPNGFDYLMTARGHNLGDIVKGVPAFENALLTQGYQPVGGYRPPAQSLPKEPTPEQREAELRGVAPPPQKEANSSNGELSFPAERLVCTLNKGQQYWKVVGGQFSKCGVAIWPEVLKEAGFFVSDLNPTQSYSLRGSVAHYVTNDKGNPRKVTKLVSNSSEA